MAYETARPADVDSQIPEEKGGMWFLKDALDTNELGFTILELDPSEQGMEHNHEDQGQEEIYYVESGQVTVEVEDDTVALSEGEAIRIAADTTRQIVNEGNERARLVLVGAPAR